MNVACSTTSGSILGAGLWELGAKKRGWTISCASIGGLWGFEGVASSSSAGAHVSASVWVWLGDLVGRHVEVCFDLRSISHEDDVVRMMTEYSSQDSMSQAGSFWDIFHN